MRFIQSIHQILFLVNFCQKEVDTHSCKNVSRDLFNLSPLSNKCNREEYFDKHVYLSIFHILKQRPHWSILVTVVLLRLELYLVWWTNSSADQVFYLDLILI